MAHEARAFMRYGIETTAGPKGYGPEDGSRIFAQLERATLFAPAMGDIAALKAATRHLG